MYKNVSQNNIYTNKFTKSQLKIGCWINQKWKKNDQAFLFLQMFYQGYFLGCCVKNRSLFAARSHVPKFLDIFCFFLTGICAADSGLVQGHRRHFNGPLSSLEPLLFFIECCTEVRRTLDQITDQVPAKALAWTMS